MVKIEDQGRLLSFDPSSDAEGPGGFIPFPGAKAKFTLRRDPVSGAYLTLANVVPDPDWLFSRWDDSQTEGLRKHLRQRNVLALCTSADLYRWRVVKTLLQDDSGLAPEDSVRLTGYQYVDWQFDGDDLIYVVRTAARGARNFHDSNRILFGRERGFRSLL